MRRGIKEGISFGIVAGIVFAVVQMLAAGAFGEVGLMPLRLFASVVLGERAVTTTEVGMTVFLGILVHFVLSAAFGAVYGLIEERMREGYRRNLATQAAFGMVFGVVLWLVNYQIIARILYPWFLMTPQGIQMMIHALAFGLPLGLLFGAWERAERRIPTT
jgi:hypothetical protein